MSVADTNGDGKGSNAVDQELGPRRPTLVRVLARNRVFIAADFAGWSILPALALALRLDGFAQLPTYLPHVLAFIAVAFVVKTAVLVSFRVYRRYWRYASVEDLLLVLAAAATAAVASTIVYWILAFGLTQIGPRLPRSVPIIDGLLTIMYLGGTRFATRAFERLKHKRANGHARTRVLIVGAGGAGTMIAKELDSNPQLGLKPVGFIDDDPLKHDRTILGLPVVGGRDAIANAKRRLGVEQAVIAIPTAPGKVVREFRDICDEAKLPTKTIPGIYEIISGRVQVSHLRDVRIEDLLRREPVRTDQRAVTELVRGRMVLVSGAGGSIGSEICRQVAALGAKELVLLGHGENSIYATQNELLAKFPELMIFPVIADVRDKLRIKRVFDTYRPQVVFHAAAHKHVPLMESNPEEAITNNIGGTLNMLDAAERVQTPHFVFISTDKAVNPTSIMGATKLVSEKLVHDAAIRTGSAFVSVRFGNVLASRGSVVPIFEGQIARGGPVTVTDPEMCRYFMTIPEAVQLVFQAATLGKGGETFVLDMGEPVKIVDLATDLIKLSGLEVGRDIEIKFTGLRPGEKMYEELFVDGEEFDRTSHEKIVVARNGNGKLATDQRIQELLAAARDGEHFKLRQILHELLPVDTPVWAEAAVRERIPIANGINVGRPDPEILVGRHHGSG